MSNIAITLVRGSGTEERKNYIKNKFYLFIKKPIY